MDLKSKVLQWYSYIIVKTQQTLSVYFLKHILVFLCFRCMSSSHFRVSNAITCIRWDWNAEINDNIEYNTRNHQNIAKLMIYNHNICFFTINIFAYFVWGFFQWILCALLSPFYFFLGAGNVRASSKAGKILINVAVSIFKFCCPRLKMKKRYMFYLFTLKNLSR